MDNNLTQELRRDPIIGRWVIIASGRSYRPSDFQTGIHAQDDISKCPFCSGHENQTPHEVLAYHNPGREKDTPGWWLRVVPNKYPALQSEGRIRRQGDGMYDKMSGIGAHEVVIETPNHFEHFADLDAKRAQDIFWAFRDRMTELKKDPRFQYILVFKNYGRSAGATLSHPHSQLIALPMVPIRVRQEMIGAKNYFDYKERCVFCDIIREEQATGSRVVGDNGGFLAIEPYASRFPFETWIIPKHHVGHFEKVEKEEVADLAALMQSVLARLRKVLGDPPLNFIIHTTPCNEAETVHYHWHIEIMPKLTQVAGFEWGTGFYINPVQPEHAASLLNGA